MKTKRAIINVYATTEYLNRKWKVRKKKLGNH
jgi:hypothetical protein